MAPLARKAATYARMTLEARPWDSHRQPAARMAFLHNGTSEAEEIREGISQDQAHALFQWILREIRKSAQAAHHPVRPSDGRGARPAPEDQLQPNRTSAPLTSTPDRR